MTAMTGEAPERRACRATEPTYTAADLEEARRKGREEAGAAIDWQTSCLGCAGRLADDRAAYERGGEDMAGRIVDELRALYLRTEERALVDAWAIAAKYAGTSPPTSTDATMPL